LIVLRRISLAYFFYLFIFSGLEFTITFLVHNRFDYDRFEIVFLCLEDGKLFSYFQISVQQGKMFLFIGIVMSLIQGGYVRRIKQDAHFRACTRVLIGFLFFSLIEKLI
jgi:hypothetical protein